MSGFFIAKLVGILDRNLINRLGKMFPTIAVDDPVSSLWTSEKSCIGSAR
jgi:hypothetical protein